MTQQKSIQCVLMKAAASSFMKKLLKCAQYYILQPCSPSLSGPMSFVSRADVSLFLFHVIISSEVAFQLPIKQARDLGWRLVLWIMCCLIFSFSFQIHEVPGTPPELFGRLFALSCLRAVSVELLRVQRNKTKPNQANLKVVQLLLKYVSRHLIPLCVTG